MSRGASGGGWQGREQRRMTAEASSPASVSRVHEKAMRSREQDDASSVDGMQTRGRKRLAEQSAESEPKRPARRPVRCGWPHGVASYLQCSAASQVGVKACFGSKAQSWTPCLHSGSWGSLLRSPSGMQAPAGRRKRKCDLQLSLFVRWHSPAGKTKVTRLQLRSVGSVDCLQVWTTPGCG